MLEGLKGFGKIRPHKLPPAYVEIFDHFFRDFLTRHRITPGRNATSTNQNANVNLQCVP